MDLLHEIAVIRTERSTLTIDQLKERHSKLSSKYPKLFEFVTAVSDEDYDPNIMSFMVQQKQKLEESNDSLPPSKLETDMTVSLRLADKFIFNETNRPSQNTLDACKKKLRKAYDH
jgi:hypothetical protein